MKAEWKTESYFRELDPPSGGLERLRRRLERPRWPSYELVPAAAALTLVMVAGLWFWQAQDGEQQRAATELRQVFEQARRPALAIDGREPRALELTDSEAVVYWLD